MKSLLIAVDIDDVLAGFMNQLLIFMNKKLNKSLKRDDITNYSMWTVIGCSKKRFFECLFEFYNSEEFGNEPLIKGAVEAISQLSKKHRLVSITSRPNITKEKTSAWIKNNFPNMFSGIYHTNQISQSGQKLCKGRICKELGVDLVIEDHLQYAKDCANNQIKVFLIDSPWNQTDKSSEMIERVYSWKEIFNKISTEASQQEGAK